MATRDAYRDLLERLLPRGVIWRRAAAGEVGRWLDAFADELGRLHERFEALVDEADPTTTSEMLSAWERVAGLPDPLLPEPTSDDERRAALTTRIVARGGQSIAYFASILAAAGFEPKIVEFSPCRAGLARAGDPCYGAAWRFAWQVTLPAGAQVVARAGAAVAGDRLVSVARTSIEYQLRRIRPAHTILLFDYET